MVGGVTSTTVKMLTHEAKLPAPSVAVTVTECGPKPTSVPAAGDCDSVIGPQLSDAEADAVKSGTAAWQLASALPIWLAPHVTLGGVVSETMKLVLHSAKFPAPSVARTVTTVVPSPTSVPAAGT